MKVPADQRRLPSLATLFAVATCVAVTLLSAEAKASCKGGFCVSGQDDRGLHIVNFTTTWKNVTHFNWFSPFTRRQYELGANQRQFSFTNLPSGTIEQFALQACAGGGFLQKSGCGPWVYFTHKVP